MKKYAIMIFVIMLLIGVAVGNYMYEREFGDDGKIAIEPNNSNKLRDTNNDQNVGRVQRVNSEEKKVSPNAKITFETLYVKCNHSRKTTQDVPKDIVNLSRDDIKEKYKKWKIKEFTDDKISLYQEMDEFCNEHYMLKEFDGYIAIYTLDENDDVNYLLRITEIPTTYLTPIDLEKLGDGIKIYTDTELNKVLEDYE